MFVKYVLDPVEDRAFIARCEANGVSPSDLFREAVNRFVSERMKTFMADPRYDRRESEFVDTEKGVFEGEVNPFLLVRPP